MTKREGEKRREAGQHNTASTNYWSKKLELELELEGVRQRAGACFGDGGREREGRGMDAMWEGEA